MKRKKNNQKKKAWKVLSHIFLDKSRISSDLLFLLEHYSMRITCNNEVSGSEIHLSGKRNWPLTGEEERIKALELRIPAQINGLYTHKLMSHFK